jgi:hypothetical protein
MAQGVDGVMTVTLGYYTNESGRRVSLVGAKIPYHGERISPGTGPARNSGYQGLDATVYSNDNGMGSYIVSGIANPSALDDVLMSGGAGAIWQQLTMGLNANISNPNQLILIRWIGYSTFTPGLGTGVSAFSNAVMDFGGAMTFVGQQVPGTFKLTFNVSGYGLISPVNQLYFAQQFRVWDGTGNPDTPFRMDFDNVFSIGFPSPGQSQETFYFDGEPDGIYDETELDVWPAGSEANLLLVVLASQSGTVDTRLPGSYTYEAGTAVSGGLTDLWDSDNLYLVGGPGVVLSNQQSPLRLVLTSTATSTSATQVAMEIEAKSTSSNVRQVVEFFNYTTNAWVQGDARQMSTTEATIQVVAPGTPTAYIQAGSRQIRTRLSYKQTGPILAFPWRISWDRAVWKISRP